MIRFNNQKELEEYRTEIDEQNAGKIRLCISGGTCGCAAGANRLESALRTSLEEHGLLDQTRLMVTGCHGFCPREPMLLIDREDWEHGADRILYTNVQEKDAAEIVEHSIAGNKIIERLIYQHPDSGTRIASKEKIPFFELQTRRLLNWNDRIDPLEIDDYIALGGYRAVARALTMESKEIIDNISKACLRGRGGAGFPTALKWKLTREATEKIAARTITPTTPFIVCNADEGDPGAYMDRSLLEGNPHSVIEGMIIGARAISEGIMCRPKGCVYVRAEYPMAIEHLHNALRQAREAGLLGENILGSELSFDIEISKGAGAFVCGEETALLESLEGKIGEPRPKPPYPVARGLWSWPTVLNNVKTWASCRYIFDHGAEDFAGIGTENSKGTMVFALVGKVENSGLVEVPMGVELRSIVEDIGHGTGNGGKIKAVQTGGPSGGCLPAEKLDLPVDYASLTEAGTIMGSGGMIVMDEQTCMVDTARYFLHFAAGESCGKCTPCREGVQHMYNIVNEIVEGRGRKEHLKILERMSEKIVALSFCGLGKTAPNPALSTLRYFREEYEAHLEGRCPAKSCSALIRYEIIEEKCTGCGVCARKCPAEAISGEKRQLHWIDSEKCIKCGICLRTCKFNAIEVE